MKVLYYDCFCGISGDMNMAALIDLGVDKEYLINEISKLQLDSEYEIKIEKSSKSGISGIRVEVILKEQQDTSSNNDVEHKHEHEHEHIHNHHQHDCNHEHEHGNHHHRNLGDIREIIENSQLNNNVKKVSMDIFMKVAQAEGLVHNKPVEEVNFHEVGAVDSIIDIVGAAICLDYLKVDRVLASSVQIGGGFVKCAHGTIPVPAPATVEILKGVPIKTGIVQFETTTPTGAAILAANVEEYIDKIEFSIDKIGYGIGHRDLEIPNILRVYLGNTENKENICSSEEQYVIETNIDDMSPELYPYVEEKLLANGALDVNKTSIIMKKGRPATKLTVITKLKNEKNVLDVIFKETTSIGVRKYKVDMIKLKREIIEVETKYGTVRVKNSYYEGELVKFKAEYEDCKKLADQNKVSIQNVYKEVNSIIAQNEIR